MIKFIAMDVDNTLAKLNEPILKSTIKRIKNIKESGKELMMISGKPVAYLAGMARQLGIKDIFLSGENGVSIHKSIGFPPRKVYDYPVKKCQKEILADIKETLNNRLNDSIWFQPNEVQVTVFFFDDETKNRTIKIVEEAFLKNDVNQELKYYIHVDCVDIVPRQISKGNAIKMYMKKNGIKSDEIITIGDGVNDISMFNESDISILIGASENIKTTHQFENIDSALRFVGDKIEGGKK